MATFVLGLVILFVGAALYGKFCEKVFGHPPIPSRTVWTMSPCGAGKTA